MPNIKRWAENCYVSTGRWTVRVVTSVFDFQSYHNNQEQFLLSICSGSRIQDCPPDLPESGADSIYSYENLPSKHWKKYIYAYRFVQMVRSKTPKVTYYSSQAKCQLMETLEDFEAAFYDGTKIIKSSNGQMKAIDEDGHQLDLGRLTDQRDAMYSMNTHFQQCHEHCHNLERLLRDLRTEGECFPIIIGRRPAMAPASGSNTNMMTPRMQNVSDICAKKMGSHLLTIFIHSSRCLRLP